MNPIRRPILTGSAVFAAFLALGAAAARRQAAPKPAKRTEMVRMSDGVRLATDMYVPDGAGPFPVVLVRTPYDKNGLQGLGAASARAGIAVVAQDTRGRFASQGENLPFVGDGWAGHRDGYDTLEWLAAQPWCNGKIGTMGGSALGITQVFEAGAGSSHITAQYIQVAAPSFYDPLTHRGGVLRKAMIEDWVRATKHDLAALQVWRDHPNYDAWWRDRDMATRWHLVNAPAVHVGGWYDIFTQGTIDTFLGYQTHGGPKARGNQKLVIGPWTHGIMQARAGDLAFPQGATPPGGIGDAGPWMDHYLKGVDNGVDHAPAVTYYVMGDATDPHAPGNLWRTADRWPPVPTLTSAWYLHGDRSLSPVVPVSGRPLDYAYDPKDPVATVGGPQLTLPAGPLDQRKIEGRPDVLVFTSTALPRPIEVTGRVRVRLWASSDAQDTDWVAKLCDVYPDGRSINVCEGILRARYRRSFSRPEPVPAGKPELYDIDLWSTSMIFNRAHKVRVLVTSSSAPGYEPNPNTWDSSAPPRVAHNRIYTDAHHASAVLLPLASSAQSP